MLGSKKMNTTFKGQYPHGGGILRYKGVITRRNTKVVHFFAFQTRYSTLKEGTEGKEAGEKTTAISDMALI